MDNTKSIKSSNPTSRKREASSLDKWIEARIWSHLKRNYLNGTHYHISIKRLLTELRTLYDISPTDKWIIYKIKAIRKRVLRKWYHEKTKVLDWSIELGLPFDFLFPHYLRGHLTSLITARLFASLYIEMSGLSQGLPAHIFIEMTRKRELERREKNRAIARLDARERNAKKQVHDQDPDASS